MSKRDIHSKSGKQLYLNQIFYKGMLYTSSEMQEGYARVIDNYDIAPTGDSASPRRPLMISDIPLNNSNDYIFPIKFKQDTDSFSYIKFLKNYVITEEDYANNTNIPTDTAGVKTVSIIKRQDNALNESSISFNNIEYSIEGVSEQDSNNIISEYKNIIENAATGDGIINKNNSTVRINYYTNNNEFRHSDIEITKAPFVITKLNGIEYIGVKIIETPIETDTNIPIPIDILGQVDYDVSGYCNVYNNELNSNTILFKVDASLQKVLYSGNLSLLDEPCFYDSEYLYIELSLTQETELQRNLVNYIGYNNIEVDDGDTFHNTTNNIYYRIFGIDTPEKKYKWYMYAKNALHNIIKYNGNSKIITSKKNKDAYGRTVSECFIGVLYDVQSETFVFYSIEEIMLKLGLATMRYIDRDSDQELFDNYTNFLSYSLEHKYKRYSNTDFDPYYLNPSYYIGSNDKNNLKITSDMIIQPVCIKSSYDISSKSKEYIDIVDPVYISSIDAVTFVGRIIDTKELEKIIYKGPIFLKSNFNNVYTILLPSNEGAGPQPNLVEATTDGYNLLNKNIISIENNHDENKVFSINGLAAIATDRQGLISEPIGIVSKAVLGQNILLKAIINEDGYYIKGVPSTTDNYGYEIVVSNISITRTPIEGQGSQEIPINNIVFKKVPGDTSGSNTNVIDFKEYENMSGYNITLNNSIKVTVNLIKPNGEYILVLDNVTYTNNIEHKLFYGSVFEIMYLTKYNSTTKVLTTTIRHNLNSINKTFIINSQNKYTLEERSDISLDPNISEPTEDPQFGYKYIPLELYSQWYVSYDKENFNEISEPVRIYDYEYKNDGYSFTKNEGLIWDNLIKPTDVSYQITNNTDHMFKFIIKPKISLKINNDCPPALRNIYLENTFSDMYYVMPVIDVGITSDIIYEDDLLENIDFKNATRIGIFNNQLCLYGPYTKSNCLFFSKFEQYDYFSFPYSTIEFDEPITYIYNYKDSLIVFGKYNIHMLYNGISVNECLKSKIYENLSVHLPEIKTINTSGNNLMFFNNGVGYIIIPNTYVDNSSSIRVYKLTESISNFFYNPETYIRSRISTFDLKDNLNYTLNFNSYVQNSNIVIVLNINISNGVENTNLVTWFIYDQNYKYWRMYSTELFDSITNCYICEPNYNNQFVVTKDNESYISYFMNTSTVEYFDYNIPIVTMLDSGYLSVDTMNDKRFKDIIIEVDNVDPKHNLLVNASFFIDSSPILLGDETSIVVDKVNYNMETEKEITSIKQFDIYHSGGNKNEDAQVHIPFGTTFKLDNTVFSTSGRTHIRIPVFGKGRLPSFILKISSKGFYEFINYALIYKEKNINRRS